MYTNTMFIWMLSERLGRCFVVLNHGTVLGGAEVFIHFLVQFRKTVDFVSQNGFSVA